MEDNSAHKENYEHLNNNSKNEENKSDDTSAKNKKSFAQIRSLNRKSTMKRNLIASGSDQQCNVLYKVNFNRVRMYSIFLIEY